MYHDVVKANSLRISAIVHATEDSEKVRKALSIASSSEQLSSEREERKFKGHHGNEITVAGLLLRRSEADTSFEFLWKRLPPVDQEAILNSIRSYMDQSGDLHLRLDKEECFRGILRIQNSDPIKVQVSFLTRGHSTSWLADKIKGKLESLME